MKKKALFFMVALLTLCNCMATANVVENKLYKYTLEVGDGCTVSHEGDDDMGFVKIVSPDGNSVVYIATTRLKEANTVFKNEVMETLDGQLFAALDRKPDETSSPFFICREDHFYKLDSETCRTRTYLWNDKACLIAGFSSNGDMAFVDKCIADIKTHTTLGRFAQILEVIVLLFVFVIIFALKEEGQWFLLVVAVAAAIAALYYFHYVLDYDLNQWALSLF